MIQTVYFLLIPTVVVMSSVYAGDNFDVAQQLNQQMFDHHFSY